MARQINNIKLIMFSILFFPALVSAAEGTDPCFDEQGSYAISACLDRKIEVAKKDYNTARKSFVAEISKNLEGNKKFNKLEQRSNKNWLSFLESNCEMQAFIAGDKDSTIFQTEYQRCILDHYKDRIKLFKSNMNM